MSCFTSMVEIQFVSLITWWRFASESVAS